ncbi:MULTISPECIES: hypothetical protein [unclassified Synechococcus]|uniref:hypothetical protein n=1 Tax=unclassified Synechococcus TaxID=2626047 RepID=UPI0039AFDA67
MLRNVKSVGPVGPRNTTNLMTYPFGAAKTELEKAFALPSLALPSLALPSLQRPSATDPASDPREITETDRAVALFEHPDH